MTTNYIRALALRHAALEQRIEAEMKAPLPDTLKLMRLKKLRLACRDHLREAINQKRRKKARQSIPPARMAGRSASSLPPHYTQGA